MKRIMSISLVLIMLTLYVFTIPAFALDRQSKIISGGAREATAEQIARAEPKIEISRNAISGGAREATEEQMESVEEKNHTARQTRSIYALGVKYYGQETSTSCGPACVRMALSWLSNNNYSEDEIRNGTNWSPSVGTYLSDLVNYLNQEQQNNHYVCRYGESMDTMTEDHGGR